MKILKNNLINNLNIRTEKDFPKVGIEFIDINPLIMDNKLLNEITDKFYNELKDKNIDYIVAPEARGFLFASSVCDRLKTGLIPVRKKGKFPPSTVESSFSYEKEYGKDILELPKLIDSKYEGKNFYIIDDIFATGNTINSIKEAILSLGGNVIGIGVVLNIVKLNNEKDLFSLIDVEEE